MPEWLGDIAQQGSADESGEWVFSFEAVTVAFPGLHRDILFLDRDLVRQRPQGVKIARAGVGGYGERGKRDGYDIDKMGSFGLWFGDATNSAGRSWWNGFSRLESRRGANAVVRESGRLPSIRAGFAGYS